MRWLPRIGSLFLKGLHATLRVRHIGEVNLASLPQYIVAFWHDHLLLMLHARYRKPMTPLISQSKDGEIIARILEYYDVDSARGSSTRGGSGALRGLIRVAREGNNLAFTPDGPKGPPRIAKEGVVVAAQATGLPIVPIAFAAKKKSCCDRGIGWSSRFPSRAWPFSMACRSSYRAMATLKNGASRSKRP